MSSDSDINILACDPPEGSVVFVERKGAGHPDTLADNLAEALSRNYSQYTKEHFGAILHHNFDKTGILGGRSFVGFGKGMMIAPVRVLVNGRVSASFANEDIPYEKIISDTVYKFFEEAFGDLIPSKMITIDMNLSSASSPGHSDANTNGSARNNWFNPQSLEDLPEASRLFSNDTSIGCGYYPMHPLETFVLDLEYALTSGEFKKTHPWIGSDVKIMGTQIQDTVDITLCVPQIANFVDSLDEYKANLEEVRIFLNEYAEQKLGRSDARFNMNTRDDYEKVELYLTATGSSIESGDEGLVGRGNRVNQVISINSPMSMEGAAGKNPVYHVGKLYYLAAHKIAQAIYQKFKVYNEVYLVSQSGRDLTSPWKTVVKVDKNARVAPDEMKAFIARQLQSIPSITEELLDDRIKIS